MKLTGNIVKYEESEGSSEEMTLVIELRGQSYSGGTRKMEATLSLKTSRALVNDFRIGDSFIVELNKV